MDKSLILERLRELKKIPSRNQFAKFLGVTAQTLNNWYNRNTFDLEVLIVKFPEVRAAWFVSGEGEMLDSAVKNSAVFNGVSEVQSVGDANKIAITNKQNVDSAKVDDLVAVTKKALENEAMVLAMNETLQAKLCDLVDKMIEKM